jgi:hypothetical protein
MSFESCIWGGDTYLTTHQLYTFALNLTMESIIICQSSFTNLQYYEKGGAISIQYSTDNDEWSQIYLNQNSFFNISAQYGGAIYYQAPREAPIYQNCFIETKAEKGRAIYFIGGSSITINWISFKNSHIRCSRTPWNVAGKKKMLHYLRILLGRPNLPIILKCPILQHQMILKQQVRVMQFIFHVNLHTT